MPRLGQPTPLKSVGNGCADAWIASLSWNPKPVEILVALLSLSRVYLLAPWDQFGFSPALYSLMRAVPQQVWGSVSLVLGTVALLLALGDRKDRRLFARCAASCAQMGQWVIYSTLFLLSNPRSFAWADRAVVALACVWCIANLFNRGVLHRLLNPSGLNPSGLNAPARAPAWRFLCPPRQ